ncbi:MAG: hypothetical protein CMH48_03705 [Muricauda sp.]|nr:hypothetical protein [Allomuricauda sp.]|tara:strand:+ start:48491 stop:49831 length:1341 start_codon:yes stop_codon:yes gene_type:complete
MRLSKTIYTCILGMACFYGWGQELAYNGPKKPDVAQAHQMAFEGDHTSAKDLLLKILSKTPDDIQARSLLASTFSWSGKYDEARKHFNKITSEERTDRDVWISAIKNELYAKEDATALGLANKALYYLKDDNEIERLKNLALERITNKKYPEKGWHNQGPDITNAKADSLKKDKKNTLENGKETGRATTDAEGRSEASADTEEFQNRIGINNSFTVFSERFDPQVFSSISFRRKTLAGSIIPKINYSNRLGKHGVQYDIDFYPKFSKRFYAYLNYGHSNADIYPRHKMGGDLYVNLPGAFEFSAGGRYIITNTREVKAITNSLGHYRGNYYFSLRSFITPRPDGLTRVSGNLLVRKYLKDAENFLGVNVGMGVSPELRQIIADDQLLAETLFFIESQRLNLEYQFTGKNGPNIYRARLGVRRQELASDLGNFFWGVTAGLVYQVKF